MAKPLLLLFIALLLCGCTPQRVRIRPEKRILVTGKVLDRNSVGLSGISVVSSGALRGNISGSPYHILGAGRTTASGDFSFISLDTYNSDFSISINAKDAEAHNTEYASLHYIKEEEDLNTELNLRQLELPKKVIFNFSIINTSGAVGEIEFSITFLRQELFYSIVGGDVINEPPADYYLENFNTERGIHGSNREAFSKDILTLSGSEIIFTYSIGEEGSHEITIPVTENGSYVFEY